MYTAEMAARDTCKINEKNESSVIENTLREIEKQIKDSVVSGDGTCAISIFPISGASLNVVRHTLVESGYMLSETVLSRIGMSNNFSKDFTVCWLKG